MKAFRNLTIIFFVLIFSIVANAQKEEILATANGQNYTVKDLDPATREAYEGLNKSLATARTELLGEQIAQMLFKDEAAVRKITVDKLLETEIPKRLTAPTATEIKAVYDANREQIGNATLEQVRSQIVNFLQRSSYPKAVEKYVGELKLKHKVVIGKDVNAPNLLATDVLATVNTKPLTVQTFNEKAGQSLYEIRADVYEKAYNYLENTIYTEFINLEAKKADITSSDLIAREVTDKMKDFSEEEREKLEAAFHQKLVQKYNIKFLLKEPTPFVNKVSVDNDPSQGSMNAPVTIVMFSDFQCPACSATHPVLKKIMAEYGDKIRFVVRDFPLTQIHNNSFMAAQAANAANAQGKFFEYIELLYNNQDSLDTANLKRFAVQIGLNPKQFDADLDSGRFADEVRKDMADGNEYGINSTPTIFINGVKARTLSAPTFRKLIDWALKK